MTDEPTNAPTDERDERVRRAFDDLESLLGERAAEARPALQALRSAMSEGDTARAQRELSIARERHGWLYDELARHPAAAALVHELALWGF